MKRKYWFFWLTLVFHALINIGLASVIDNVVVLLLIFFTVLFTGVFIKVYPDINNMKIKDLGWGMLFGSLAIMAILFVFLVLSGINAIRIS
jgi:hypothetical protein